MEKPQPKEGMLKIPSETTTIRLIPFSFVPVLKKLPTEGKLTVGEQERQPMRMSHELVKKQKEAAGALTMSGDGVFKADFVYVGGNLDERQPGGGRTLLAREPALRQEAQSQYKIKSSYKALAAIPTNTLLLEQQAIDDEVEKEGRPVEETDLDRMTETHSEMCSPAQMRQQSEELYAAIDQVLQDPLPMRRSQSAPLSLMTPADVEVPKKLTSLSRSAGRETKYATFNLQPPASAERTLTKPGIIRPVTVIPKLTAEEVEEDFPNPFRQQYLEEQLKEQSQKVVSTPADQIGPLAENHRQPGSSTFRQEAMSRSNEAALLITEKEDASMPPMAEGTSKKGPASNPAPVKGPVHETHI